MGHAVSAMQCGLVYVARESAETVEEHRDAYLFMDIGFPKPELALDGSSSFESVKTVEQVELQAVLSASYPQP